METRLDNEESFLQDTVVKVRGERFECRVPINFIAYI